MPPSKYRRARQRTTLSLARALRAGARHCRHRGVLVSGRRACVQVRRAEAYIQAGDERAFVQCMTDLVDAQSQLERETKEAMVRAPMPDA